MKEVFTLNLNKNYGIDTAANIDVKDINGFLQFSGRSSSICASLL